MFQKAIYFWHVCLKSWQFFVKVLIIVVVLLLRCKIVKPNHETKSISLVLDKWTTILMKHFQPQKYLMHQLRFKKYKVLRQGNGRFVTFPWFYDIPFKNGFFVRNQFNQLRLKSLKSLPVWMNNANCYKYRLTIMKCR